MKAIVDPSILIKELKKISPVISKNQILPVLECVKLDFDKKELTITGTDMDTWVSYKMECANKSPFSVVIPVGDMIDICGKASGPITVVQEEKFTKFIHDGGTIKIPIHAQPKEFPSIEDVEYFNIVEVEGDFFHAVSGANVCRSKDNIRPSMNGIGIDFKKDAITVVGVDGQIMYKQDFTALIEKPILISVNTVFAELSKVFQDSTISVSDKYLKVEYGTTVIVSRLSESAYVDYNYVLRGNNKPYNVTVNRKDLISKIDIIDIATTRNVRDILFTLTPGKIHMYTTDVYAGKEAETEFNADHELHLSIRFKGDVLKSLLNTITEESISLSITDPTGNVYIKPEDNNSIILSIMPLQLN